MNKIFNWTFGSIFRTIGRIIAYLIIGFILFSFINFDKIKDDIKSTIDIGSWVSIPRTYASVLTENVSYSSVGVNTATQDSNVWSNTNGMFVKDVYSQASEQVFRLVVSGVNTTSADYVQFSFSVSQPSDKTTESTPTSSQLDYYCSKWELTTWTDQALTGGSHGVVPNVYTCKAYTAKDAGGTNQFVTTSQEVSALNFTITADYSGGSWSMCQIESNNIVCPNKKAQITNIDFHINFRDNFNSYVFQLMVHRSVGLYVSSDSTIINNQNQNTQSIINNQNQNNQSIINNQNSTTQQVIQNQNQNAQNLNSTLTDDSLPTNMSGLDNSFLSGLLPPGPLDSVINIPLSIMNTIVNTLSGTCSPIVLELPFIHENLTIPCISSIFSNITGLIDFYNGVGVIASAFILYKYLCYLYYWFDDVSSMKNVKPRLFGVSSNADYWGGD